MKKFILTAFIFFLCNIFCFALEPDTGLRPHLFLCTDYEGEPDCLDLEMSGAKFRTLAELDELAASMFQPFADGLKILKTCIDTALFFGDDDGEMLEELAESVGEAVAEHGSETNISENPIDKSVKTVTIKYQDTTEDGGPGSGNHGHKGRPGQKGGSEHSLGPKEKAKIEKRLVGQRTHDGVEIRSVSAHAFDRIGGRKMSVGRIDKMRTDGVPSPGNRPHTRCYDIEGSRMVVDTESGNVMTVMWRGGRKK